MKNKIPILILFSGAGIFYWIYRLQTAESGIEVQIPNVPVLPQPKFIDVFLDFIMPNNKNVENEPPYSPALTPRGIRNNNPGNLVITGIQWLGKVPREENTDGKFEQFVAPQYGIRAMYKDLTGDIERKGFNTVRKLINSYAPPHENHTARYIEFVASELNISPDVRIMPFQYRDLIAAVIKFENGQQPYSNAFLESSFQLTA